MAQEHVANLTTRCKELEKQVTSANKMTKTRDELLEIIQKENEVLKAKIAQLEVR